MLLWAEAASPSLPSDWSRQITASDNDVLVSAASIWEASIKRTTGKLKVNDDLLFFVDKSGFERLEITFEHAWAAGALPRHHGDPFDRLLVAQAQIEGLTIVTSDPAIQLYNVAVLEPSGG